MECRLESFLSVLAIVSFIPLGYVAKRVYREQIDEKTLTLISVYCLQPILIFWGLNQAPISISLLATPVVYLGIVLCAMALFIGYAKIFFKDYTHQAIFIVGSLVGNTGNFGIPLALALFGMMSVPYATMISITTLFFSYTFGIFFFARNHYSLKDSLLSIGKIPIIWVGIIALAFNAMDIGIAKPFEQALQMGAYAALVLQLVLFGTYLGSLRLETIEYKFSLHVSFAKLILLPLVGLVILWFIPLQTQIKAILLLQLMLPLSLNNVNTASLYNSKPIVVAGCVLISTVLFFGVMYGDLWVIDTLMRRIFP